MLLKNLSPLLRYSQGLKLTSRNISVSCVRNDIVKIQSTEDFKDKVINSKVPVVVDFFATMLILLVPTTGSGTIPARRTGVRNSPGSHFLPKKWCNPCRLLTPRLEAIISENKGKVVLAKVDIDEQTDLALDYEVNSVPVLVAIKNGKVQQRLVGLQDADKLRKWIDQFASEESEVKVKA